MGALSVYLDTSVIVPLFLPDVFVERARAFLLTGPSAVIVSDLVTTEFLSVVGIRHRMGSLEISAARAALSNFDDWTGGKPVHASVQPSDFLDAQHMLRRLDLVLRAPDALNLAVTRRIGAELATFDRKLIDCARQLNIPVVSV